MGLVCGTFKYQQWWFEYAHTGFNVIIVNWILRFVKGAVIGSGFILPGVSGGALAAALGLYEKIIGFIAHPVKDFVKNLCFFIPVALGALTGIILLAYPVRFLLYKYEAPVLWLFVGSIAGTFPLLWKNAEKKSRKKRHIVIMVACAFFAFFGLRNAAVLLAVLLSGNIVPGIVVWALCGALIALGIIVPGLSPSNFLLFMGMYKPMLDAFKNIELGALLPLFAGAAICLLLFSKLVDIIFVKAYTCLFHVIMGLVIASTVMIIPIQYNYSGTNVLICVLTCGAGVVMGLCMGKLETRHKE
jgi:putative membrane protein